MWKSSIRQSAIIAAILLIALVAATSAQPRRPTASMAPADILRVANVSDAQISPDGKWVVYTVSTITGNESTSTLWVARVGVDFAAPTITPLPSGPQRGRPVILSDRAGEEMHLRRYSLQDGMLQILAGRQTVQRLLFSAVMRNRAASGF